MSGLRVAAFSALVVATVVAATAVSGVWILGLGTALLLAGLTLLPIRVPFAWTWLPVVLTASAALLPLLQIAGLPADNYVAAMALPLAAWAIASSAPPDEPWIVFSAGAGLLAVSAVVSSAIRGGHSSDSALRFLSYAATLAVMGTLTTAQRERAARGVIGVGVVLAASIYATVLGVVGLPVYGDLESTGSRYGGLIGHPNFAAYFLSICIVYLLSRKDLRARVRLPVIGILGGAVMVTGSRGAILWLVVSAVMLLSYWRRQALLVVALVAAALATFGSVLLERFAFFEGSGGLSGHNSASWRFGQWERALALQDSFSLWGVGWRQAVNYLPGHLEVHNGYLEVWVELGAVGVAGAVLCFASTVGSAFRRGLPGVALALFVVGAGISDPVLLYPPTGYLLIVLLWSVPRRHGAEPHVGSVTSSEGRSTAVATSVG